MADKDGIDIGVSVHAEGEDVARQVADGFKQLKKVLNEAADAAEDDTARIKAAAKQAADELKASARQISVDRKAARQAEQAADRQLAANRKSARDQERAAARQATDEQRASTRQIMADRSRLREAERAANREEVAHRQRIAQANRDQLAAQRANTAAVQDHRTQWVGLGAAIFAAATAFVGFQGFRKLITEGLGFNKMIESSTLGIASLIAAQAQMTTSDGRVVEGEEKLTIATALANEQLTKLRIAGLHGTTATTEQLVVAFQQAVGVGLRFGLTLDQIRVITVQMTQAAQALGVPLNQMNEEIRSLLTGVITPRNTRIATALGITNAQIKEAQRAGTLFEFITKRLESFGVAGEAAAQTFAGTMARIKTALQVISGDITKPLFDSIRLSGQDAIASIFDVDKARLSNDFDGILSVARESFAGLGDLLAEGLAASVSGAKELSQWFATNAVEVKKLTTAAHLLAGELAGLVSDVFSLIPGLAEAGVKAGIFKNILIGAGLVIADIRTFFTSIIVALGGIGNAMLAGVVVPTVGWLRILSSVVSVFDKGIADSISNAADAGEGFLDKSLTALREFSSNLDEGNTATEKFLARVRSLDADSQKAVSSLDRLNSSLRRITAAEDEGRAALDKALTDKKISQEAYAEQTRLLDLQVVTQKLNAQKAYLATINVENVEDRRRTAVLVGELRKQRDALSKHVTLKSSAEPPEDPAAALELGRGGESALTIAARKELSIRLRDLKIALDAQLIGYREYYDEVTKAKQKALDQEIKAQEILLGATKKGGAQTKINAQIKALKDEKNQVKEDSDAAFLTDEKKLNKELVDAHVQLLKDQGHLSEARALEIGERFRVLIAQLKADGNAAGVAIVTQLFDIDTAKTRLDEMMALSKTATGELAVRLDEINTLSTAHAITESEARDAIVAAYTKAKTALEALLPAMREAAALTGDPNQIQAVENLRIRILQMEITIAQTADGLFKLKEAGRDAFQHGLTTFIDETVDATKGLSVAWQDAALQIISSLRQVAAQMLANLIIQKSLEAFGATSAMGILAGLSSSGGTAAMLASLGLAEGGIVRGPGSSTSDSIPALVSNGEYVVRAAAVRAVGVDVLDSINQSPVGRSRTRRYAEGGLVAPSAAAGTFHASLGLEDGLVVRHLETNEGTEAVVKAIVRRGKTVRSILGIK